MSTFSFSKSSSQKRKKGFSEEDVNLFLKKGANLASGSANGAAAPTEKELVTTTSRSKAGGTARAFGASNKGIRTTQSGFQGAFSSMSKEQIDALSTSFKQREQNIAQRRAQPGRSSLFMGRS